MPAGRRRDDDAIEPLRLPEPLQRVDRRAPALDPGVDRHAARSAACSTASSSGIAAVTVALHRRVLGELERDHDQVGGHERGVLGARDPDRGVSTVWSSAPPVNGHEDPRHAIAAVDARPPPEERDGDGR